MITSKYPENITQRPFSNVLLRYAKYGMIIQWAAGNGNVLAYPFVNCPIYIYIVHLSKS